MFIYSADGLSLPAKIVPVVVAAAVAAAAVVVELSYVSPHAVPAVVVAHVVAP